MTADPWAEADAATSGASTQNGGGSQLGESYAGKPSQLFSGGEGAGPSILNKTHKIGTTRTGIIAKPTYDRQSTNQKGEKRYWQDGQNSPVTDAVNPITHQPNRPVWDTVVVLDTDYVMSAEEAKAVNRETPYEGGQRSLILSGDDLKKFRIAVKKVAGKLGITCDEDMVGKRVTVTRAAEKPNPNGGDSIKIHEFEISAA